MCWPTNRWWYARRICRELEQAFTVAASNHVLLYDIMTERYEITTMLQRDFRQQPARLRAIGERHAGKSRRCDGEHPLHFQNRGRRAIETADVVF